MKRLLLFIFTALLTQSLSAQSVVWQMQPSDYDAITPIGSGNFKVTRNGLTGIVKSDGAIVCPVEVENIIGFYEDKALLVRNDGKGSLILGILMKNGAVKLFNEKFYTLKGQEFYSEGLLSVSDEQGKKGYIDEDGEKVDGLFEKKYDNIRPFSEGYAVVKIGQKPNLIDKRGNSQKIEVEGIIATIYNVYNGEAYFYEKYNEKYYVYNVKTKKTSNPHKKNPSTETDYLYRLNTLTKAGKNVPFEDADYRGQKGLEPIVEEGRYGFEQDEQILLPCQLSTATAFVDGLSVVEFNGKKGMLRIDDSGSFSAEETDINLNFKAKEAVTCHFTLSAPSAWSGKPLKVLLEDADGATHEPTGSAENYSFVVYPSKTEPQNYNLTVSCEGLTLYEGELEYSFTELCSRCDKTIDDCPEKGKHKKCGTCGKVIVKNVNRTHRVDECPYKGSHPLPPDQKKCPYCGKVNCKEKHVL